MKIIREMLAEAVESCDRCVDGWLSSTQGGAWCTYCLGGEVLTTEGYELVDFLAKWLAPKFAEADHGHTLS